MQADTNKNAEKSTFIIDAHAHIFPNKIAEKAVAGIGSFYNGLEMHCAGTAEDLISSGAEAGITKFIVQSVATVPEQVESINNFISRSVKKFPDNFIGFAAMHPDYPDIKKEIDRAVSFGLRGIKLHPDFQQFCIDDPKAMKIYEAAEGRMPILIHTGDSRYQWSKPERLAKVLEAFPKLDVIAAHFGGWSEWDSAVSVLGGQKYGNLGTDCSSSLYAISPERAKLIIDSYGADRVLFGTDYPMWIAAEELKRFSEIPLTCREREMILHKNAENLLKL